FSRLLVHDPEPTQIYTLSLHDALPISGITRGIPLSNTNQLWGLAWGILVWGELRTAGGSVLTKVIGGSLVMAAGAAVIAFSSVSRDEHACWEDAADREAKRYLVDRDYTRARAAGRDVDDTPH